MGKILTLQERLDCQYSYCEDDNPNLLCSIGNLGECCDGTLYDCCTWNMSFSKQMEVNKRWEDERVYETEKHG